MKEEEIGTSGQVGKRGTEDEWERERRETERRKEKEKQKGILVDF